MTAVAIRSTGDPIRVIGHRGASGHRPENTILAFAHAQQLGAEWVETDLRPTADGGLALIHDPSVDRTTDGTGRVDELSLDEIRTLDAGGWYGAEYAGAGVPTLQDLLDWSSAGGCGICLHVDPRLDGGEMAGIAQAIASVGEAERALIISADFQQLKAVKGACEQISTGILYAAAESDGIEAALAAGVDFLHPHRKTVTAALIETAHDAGLPVVACVDPDAELIRQRAAWGLDVFSCDEPDLVLEVTAS
jgi:glycerophosphoryl diester phosphodiesterase